MIQDSLVPVEGLEQLQGGGVEQDLTCGAGFISDEFREGVEQGGGHGSGSGAPIKSRLEV